MLQNDDFVESGIFTRIRDIQIGKTIRAYRGWLGKGFWAVLDQGLFSSANFLVNILLARWLAPEEYGAFAVAYSIFLFLAMFHTAVLTEPMMVFGAGKYSEKFPKYLGMLLYGHWGITSVFAVFLALAALAFAKIGSGSMEDALSGLAIAAPFILLLWLARRACYVNLHPHRAVVGSGVNLILTLAGVFLLLKEAILSSFSALVILGMGATTASLIILPSLKPRIRNLSGNPKPMTVLADHYGYGSWNVLGVATYWASGQILIAAFIPIFLGLKTNAAVAAVWNLFRPVSLFLQSASLIILPMFSKLARNEENIQEWKLQVVRTALLFAGCVLLYGLIVSTFAEPILNVLYHGKYNEYWLLVVFFAFSTTASIMTQIFTLALKASGKVKYVSVIWGISAIVILVVGIPSILTFGIEGALGVFVVSYIISARIAWLRIRDE